MKASFPILFLVLTILLSACGGAAVPQVTSLPATPTRSGLEETPGLAPTLIPAETARVDPPPADPLEIAVALDESKAVEGLIPLEGGTLTLESGDGARYTLEIPPDALLEPVQVRMTAVAQIEGLPFGAPQTYAVDLQPEGLVFYQPATLTIQAPVEIPLDEQLFFGYQQGGEEVFLAPPQPNSQEMKILLTHFSGYGVTKGLLAEVEPVRARLGGSDEVRLQSQVAELVMRERQRMDGHAQEIGADSPFSEEFSRLVQEWYEKVVRPRVAAAGESCAAGRLALDTVIGFQRTLMLLGAEDDIARFPGIELNEILDVATRVCLQEEYELCTEQHIIHRMIPVWLGIERQSQLLGQSTDEQPSEVGQLARELTEKCLTFELQFESSGESLDGLAKFEGGVSASVPLRFDADAIEIRGSGVLVNEYANFYAEGCQVSYSAKDGTFEVFSMGFDTDLDDPGSGAPPAAGDVQAEKLGKVTEIFMNYFPGATSGPLSMVCEDYTYPPTESALWFTVFLMTHQDEQGDTSAGMTYVANDWTIHGEELFAERSWQRSDPSLDATEQGWMKLYHRPGQ